MIFLKIEIFRCLHFLQLSSISINPTFATSLKQGLAIKAFRYIWSGPRILNLRVHDLWTNVSQLFRISGSKRSLKKQQQFFTANLKRLAKKGYELLIQNDDDDDELTVFFIQYIFVEAGEIIGVNSWPRQCDLDEEVHLRECR